AGRGPPKGTARACGGQVRGAGRRAAARGGASAAWGTSQGGDWFARAVVEHTRAGVGRPGRGAALLPAVLSACGAPAARDPKPRTQPTWNRGKLSGPAAPGGVPDKPTFTRRRGSLHQASSQEVA